MAVDRGVTDYPADSGASAPKSAEIAIRVPQTAASVWLSRHGVGMFWSWSSRYTYF